MLAPPFELDSGTEKPLIIDQRPGLPTPWLYRLQSKKAIIGINFDYIGNLLQNQPGVARKFKIP